ncbi:MAG: hypothetical protein GY757_49355 [bacterium]|nr:hypothetical protein [bacterium]
MSSKTKEDYKRKLATIRDIGEERIKHPHHIPVGIYLQEAETLYHWVQEDLDSLTGVGLTPGLVEDLPTRCGALFEAEAIWQVSKKARSDTTKDWKTKSRQAYELREQLLSTFRFAFRKHPDLMKTVADIAKGNSNADIIQDLNDLAVLGRIEPALLEVAGFDLTLLELAAGISDEMASLLAEINCSRESLSLEKITRDQAFTHLKEGVDEIRECGRYVFRADKERFAGYRSRHLRQLKMKVSRTK